MSHLSAYLLFNRVFLSLAPFFILLNQYPHLSFNPDFAHCPSWANTGLKLSHLSFSSFCCCFFFFSDLLCHCSSSSCLSNLPNCLSSFLPLMLLSYVNSQCSIRAGTEGREGNVPLLHVLVFGIVTAWNRGNYKGLGQLLHLQFGEYSVGIFFFRRLLLLE